MNRKNDWIAINLNSGDDISIDSLSAYGINPNNTGLQSEDYYKSIKQVRDAFTDSTGKFDDSKFHDFYESAKRSYNDYQQSDFTQKIIDEIDSSPYDIFSLGSKTMDTSAAIYRSRDPQRTTMGLGNIFEVGSPTFDIREVAQANKARDEQGNVLDWSPNDKGGLLKGLFRPTMALATYDEDGTHIENGVTVSHKKGDLKLDEYGDPYYEKLGDREIYGKETLHYWDTITRDDSAWNKIDFMDSDGLTKSIGGTVMRTAFSLLPYFTPIGPYLGYVGAAIALGQTLPVLSKALDGIITGSTDDAFGKSMSSIESFMDRFGHSQSRDTMGKFLSFENIGDIIASSAGQLFQQRMIANVPDLLRKTKDGATALSTSKFGRNLALGYMIATSATDSYEVFKEAGATDRMAGIGLLGVTSGLALLMNNNYFKDMLFTGTFMDEDITMRDTIKQLVKESTVEPFEQYAAIAPKAMSKYQQKLANTFLYKQIEKNIVNNAKKIISKLGETRPTVGMLERAALSDSEKKVGLGMKTYMYLNRALNEGLEETMEEGVTDAMKLITMGLDALGVQVSKPDQELDFGLTLRDALSRYGSAFIGGAIGGAVFEGFNQFEGGSYDSLLEKSLAERLVWYERNGYGQEVRDRVNKLYKQGKLGNVNLSSKGSRVQSTEGDKSIVIYGQGDENDNQNLFTYNVINSYLDRLDAALNDNGLFTSDNKIFDKIWKAVREKRGNNDEDPEVQLYHFLEDLDTAKALTITQMGFLSALKQDADKLSYDILKTSAEIDKVKQQIRAKNNLTDADSSREKELFKSNQYLKELEDELKEKKKIWDQMLNGERNGYYMGLSKMMVDPQYDALYTNPNLVLNQKETFSKSSIDNWSKYMFGIEYSSITDEDLKKKVDDSWNAYKSVMSSTGTTDEELVEVWRNKSRALYDMHIKFGEKLAPHIIALNERMKGKTAIPKHKFRFDAIREYASQSESPELNEALRIYEHDVAQANKITDEDQRNASLEGAIKTFNTAILNAPIRERLKLISYLNDKIISEGLVGMDIYDLRKDLIRPIIDQFRVNINDKDSFTTAWTSIRLINERLQDALDDPKKLQEIIDSLPEDAVNRMSIAIENYKDAPEDFENLDTLKKETQDALYDVFPLLKDGGEATLKLKVKLNSLLDSIAINANDIKAKYDDVIDFVYKNLSSTKESLINRTTAKALVDSLIGDGLAEFAIAEHEKESKYKDNPFDGMLKELDIYTGGKLYNVIDTITKEEAVRDALKNAEDYKVTSKTREDELLTALSLIGVLTAGLKSSFDGMNEMINLSNPETQLAVSDPELASTYETLLTELSNRINNLLNISYKNKLKTTRAQQETMLNMNRKRVEQLVNRESITLGATTIDFKSEWEKTGFNIADATLENAKDFDKAYRTFQSAISKQLQSVLSEALKTNSIEKSIIEPLVKGFGLDVYMQTTGEITDSPDAVIEPYAMVNYLLTLATLDAEIFDSIWKTVCKNNSELIPLFGQEYLVRESLATAISYKNKHNIFDVLHKYIKDNFPDKRSDGKNWRDPDYIKNRELLEKFANIDGVAGVGKTQGVDYLTYEACKLYFHNNVSGIALGATEDAANGVHNALRLGKDAPKSHTFESFIKEIFTDETGKLIFDFNTCYSPVAKASANYKLKRDTKGNVIDGNGKVLTKELSKKIDNFFTTKDGLRVLYFDETGLLNSPQLLFLCELAKLHDFVIFGSGDTLQNKAEVTIKNQNGESITASNGLEDLIYHRMPPLTISMRAEKNGIYKNTELIKDLIRSSRDSVQSSDPSATTTDYSNALKEELNKKLAGDSNLQLIYSEKDYSGHVLIGSAQALDVAKQMLILIDKLKESDPSGKHRLGIVVDVRNTAKINQYRNAFGDRIDKDIFVLDPKSVQGKEFDYVVIDKTFSKDLYTLAQDFYTMITRARRGAAIVDESKIIQDYLRISTIPDETAAENVLGSDPEEKAAMFKDYVDWRNSLMEDVPEFKGVSTTTPSTPAPVPAPTGSSGSEEVKEPPVTEVVIAGTSDDVTKMSPEERILYYTQKMLEEGGYYANFLDKRDKEKNEIASVDFDLFVNELKNLEDNSIEAQPLSIAGKELTTTREKEAHRVIIATIARAILNNNTAEGRKNYISSAREYLGSKLRMLDVDSNILVSLQNSFDDGGFFFFNNDHIYYTFSHNDDQFVIPIAYYKSKPNSENRLYKNIEFNVVAGAIPITSFGEVMSPTSTIVSEIDGVVTDGENAYVGVGVIPDELRGRLGEILKKIGNNQSDTAKKIRNAITFMLRNSGKSFIVTNAASSQFQLGDKLFSAKQDANGNYTSGIDEEYDFNKVQENSLIGLQQLTSIKDWYEVISILEALVSHDPNVSGEDRLKAFFHTSESIFSKFNHAVNEENAAANRKANYKELANYKILNHEAIDRFTSAIFRLVASENPPAWTKRFLQGFTKWLTFVKLGNEDEMSHKRGFTIQFRTKTEENGPTVLHQFTIAPRLEISTNKTERIGFDILYSSTDNPGWQIAYSTNDKTPESLFENTKFDFIKAIQTVLGFNFDKDEIAEGVRKSIDLSKLSDLLRSGDLLVFPVDLAYTGDLDVGLPQRVYSPYETDVYRWITQGDTKDDNHPLTLDEITDLEDFLTKDTIFKHSLYRNIKADQQGDGTSGWGHGVGVGLTNTYVDIVKLLAPLYKMGNSNPIPADSEQELELKGKLKGFFETVEDVDGDKPAIKPITTAVNLNSNGIIEFDFGQTVNAAWLKENTTKSDWENKSYEISGYDILNNAIIVNGKVYKLKQSSQFLSAIDSETDIKKIIEQNTITSIDGKVKIVGKNLLYENTVYPGVDLLGINDNKYTFIVGGSPLTINLADSEIEKIDIKTRNRITERGIYIGEFEDEELFHVFINDNTISLYSVSDSNESPIVYNITDISSDYSSIAGMPVQDENLRLALKQYIEKENLPNLNNLRKFEVGFNGMFITLGEHSITATQLQRLVKSPEVEDGKIYHIFAYDKTRVGYYEGNDLSTFKWGDLNEFDFNQVLSADTSLNIDSINEDNPAQTVLNILDQEKSSAIKEFVKYDSTLPELRYRELQNGRLVDVITNTDYVAEDGVAVRDSRTIYSWLVNGNPDIDINSIVITKQTGQETLSPIVVIFNSNGKRNQILVRVSGDRITEISQRATNQLEARRNDVQTLIDSLNEERTNLTNLLSTALSTEEVQTAQSRLNETSSVLGRLDTILVNLEVENPNWKEINNALTSLSADVLAVVKPYVSEYRKQLKCRN